MIFYLPVISRAEHNARIERGEKASGPYAFVFTRRTTIQEHLTHSFDLRTEDDQYVTSGAANGPTMARSKAKRLGATFIVDEI